MEISHIEVSNFRRLKFVRIDLAEKQTIFVGANNSGKTSAMTALRMFLKERRGFSVREITASNLVAIEQMAQKWMSQQEEQISESDAVTFCGLMPTLDVWLSVDDDELYRVAKLIPNLEWSGEKVGVRIRLEPKSFEEMVREYRVLRAECTKLIEQVYREKDDDPKRSAADNGFSLWPRSFSDYLERKTRNHFVLRYYVLDCPQNDQTSEDALASPYLLPASAQPMESDPLAGLLHIKVIQAQRGFADASEGFARSTDESDDQVSRNSSRLSDQLQAYFKKHLDPNIAPSEEDVKALEAFHAAQIVFEERLRGGFENAITELEHVGYPGGINPKISISTRLRPTDTLNHPSAVQYEIGEADLGMRLPENYGGLGFQNLISITFLLMRFRDEWMRVGKFYAASPNSAENAIPPLQLVLIEEPEAHLHAQVQQVFIRNTYDVLRNHDSLREKKEFRTQLIVSTHSTHIVHEIDFSNIRYFKRIPSDIGAAPCSEVVNLSNLFLNDMETKRFVKRYLRSTHCDLFFADGAILVEGAAERILLPHFIRKNYPELEERYISILEIGGSHAHRLKPLIEVLSIPTLVITDLDAVDPNSKRQAVRPRIGKRQETSNSVLKKWIPRKETIDDLMKQDSVPFEVGTGFGVVGVTYQRMQYLSFSSEMMKETVIASTFEDALVFANLGIMRQLSGTKMTKLISRHVQESSSVSELGPKLFNVLRKHSGKAEFALDLLTSASLENLNPPPYISDGLMWLQQYLSRSRNLR